MPVKVTSSYVHFKDFKVEDAVSWRNIWRVSRMMKTNSAGKSAACLKEIFVELDECVRGDVG